VGRLPFPLSPFTRSQPSIAPRSHRNKDQTLVSLPQGALLPEIVSRAELRLLG